MWLKFLFKRRISSFAAFTSSSRDSAWERSFSISASMAVRRSFCSEIWLSQFSSSLFTFKSFWATSDLRTWTCSSVVTSFCFFTESSDFSFSASILAVFNSSMDCSRLSTRLPEVFTVFSASESRSNTSRILVPRASLSCLIDPCSFSLAASSSSMAAVLFLMCSAFSSSVRICSFMTSICPSRFPADSFASFSAFCFSVIFSSSRRTASEIRSYSSFKASAAALESSISPFTVCSFCASSRFCSSIAFRSARKRFTSKRFSSSRSLKYSFAVSACFARGPTCFSSSLRISDTRTRFCFSSSSFFWAIAFLRLNFTIPAASSKSSLRSSGRPLKILSICPCPMME